MRPYFVHARMLLTYLVSETFLSGGGWETEITGMAASAGDNGAPTGGGGGGWWARLLSRGGRLVLLKAVRSTIPTYYMSLFRVPVGVRKRMDATMRNFFWHGAETDGTRGQALVKWSTVCRLMAEGGLGVRNLRHTNTALLMKRVRRLMKAPSDMATQVLMDDYESVGLGPTIRAPVGPVSVLQGLETGFFLGPEDVPSKARGWGALQILE